MNTRRGPLPGSQGAAAAYPRMLLAVVLVASGCWEADGRKSLSSLAKDDETAIYSASIDLASKNVEYRLGKSRLLVESDTRFEPSWLVFQFVRNEEEEWSCMQSEISKEIGDMAPQTMFDFRVRNASPVRIEADFHTRITVRLIAELPDVRAMDLRDRNRCDGIIWLSAIGRNLEGTEALVHIGTDWGSGQSFGLVVLLRKHGGVWSVAKSYCAWRT